VARPFWLTAVLAPRFLASAFAAGPALLILLCLLIRKLSRFDPGEEAIRKLAMIVTYAMAINLFLFTVELFTVLYSDIEHHVIHFQYLFFGVNGETGGVTPFMWLSVVTGLLSLALLLNPFTRQRNGTLTASCVMVFGSIWIDKGAGMLTGGFVPSPLGHVVHYFPSRVEVVMGIGLYAFGTLVLTALYKMAISIKEESLNL